MNFSRLTFVYRFESWLKPSYFIYLILLLLFLNIFVWFYWIRTPDEIISSTIITSLKNERDKLKNIILEACDSPELKSRIGREVGLLSHEFIDGDNSTALPSKNLVGMLERASVMVMHKSGFGSGFFIDPHTVITNRHVIEGAALDQIMVASKSLGGAVKATIISSTKNSSIGAADFALLHIDIEAKDLAILKIASDPLPLENVIAVGFPGSGIQTDSNRLLPSPIFTTGAVSVVQPQENGISLVIHTADISPGSSGGALVDRCGSILGVNTFIKSKDSGAESRRLFALSANSLKNFLEKRGQNFSFAVSCKTETGK